MPTQRPPPTLTYQAGPINNHLIPAQYNPGCCCLIEPAPILLSLHQTLFTLSPPVCHPAMATMGTSLLARSRCTVYTSPLPTDLSPTKFCHHHKTTTRLHHSSRLLPLSTQPSCIHSSSICINLHHHGPQNPLLDELIAAYAFRSRPSSRACTYS
jgi:hypothetical protein